MLSSRYHSGHGASQHWLGPTCNPPRKLTIFDLNRDVLRVIFDFLLRSSYWNNDQTFWVRRRPRALLPLSLTCKALRKCLYPVLFHQITWPGHAQPIPLISSASDGSCRLNYDYESIPVTILPFIHQLRISCETQIMNNNLAQAVSNMTSLTHCVFCSEREPPDSLIAIVTAMPSLIALELLRTPITFSPHALRCRQLTRLCISPSMGFFRINGSSVDGLDATQSSSRSVIPYSLFTTNHLTLEHLHVDFELFSQALVSEISWPRLTTLIISGTTPRTMHHSIFEVLPFLPKLRDLQFRFVFQDSTLPLIPPSCRRVRDLSQLLPSLTKLTISNPSPRDRIFAMLPYTVQFLYLPSISRCRAPQSALKLDEATALIEVLSRRTTSLAGLQLILRDTYVTPHVLHAIGSKLPSLQFLEVGTFQNHYSLDNKIRHNPVYLDMLSPFKKLRILRIAVDVAYNKRKGWIGAHPSEAKFALDLGQALPTLESIGIQSEVSTVYEDPGIRMETFNTWNNWTQYDIIRLPGGFVTVRCNDAFNDHPWLY